MKTPDAVVVLAAGIKQDAKGSWVSTDLSFADDKRGAPGGKLRVLAGAALATHYSTAVIVTGGGKGYDARKNAPDNRPLLAEILCNELIARGIPKERIVLERKSNTTYQELQELEKLAFRRRWGRIVVVTSRYHLDRVRAMIEAKFTRFSQNAILEPVSAEDTLIANDRARWEALIEKEYASAYMRARRAREERSIEQIHSGVYQFK